METIAPGYVEDEWPEEPETPTPDPEPDPAPGPDPEPDPEPDPGDGGDVLPDDIQPEEDEIDEEMVALGREGVEKIEADLKSGNVRVYQYLNGALTGLGVGANANGIIISAAKFVKDFATSQANKLLLEAFGNSISAAGIACGLGQSIMAIIEGDTFSVGDWMNVISTTLGVVALVPTTFPIVTGTLGVVSGIIGIASVFVSDSIQPGLYIVEMTDGTTIYLYITDTITT